MSMHKNDGEIDNKSSNRHTPQQIEAMEAFFKECPHPNGQQRDALSRIVGMDSQQIKFWFQNKRSQIKSKQEHEKNKELRFENEKLRAENMHFKEALSNTRCAACGLMSSITDHMSVHERQLRIENARIKEEINSITALALKYAGKNDAGPSSSGRKY